MPRCVTTSKLNELCKNDDPDVAAVAQELVRARAKLAEYRDLGREQGPKKDEDEWYRKHIAKDYDNP